MALFKQIPVLLLLAAGFAAAAPFDTGTGLAPLGNLLTSDKGGPYNLTLLPVQENEVRVGIAARQNFTDHDIVDFLTNVECTEGRFDSLGTLGLDFNDNLTLGGPPGVGSGKANLSAEVLAPLTEVAVSEQGHALFTRHAGGANPCPFVNYTAGFNDVFAAAYGLPAGQDISSIFGKPFDPLVSDESFLVSIIFLEELGATGNKGLTGIISNPVINNGVAGLATTATAFAGVERYLAFERRNNIVPPTNETVAQVFARLSAYRDSMDGPQFDDQGLLNTDPRTIAIAINQDNPGQYINLFPTDVHGISFSRTPQQIINILTIGAANGKGGFYPLGIPGAFNTPYGYASMAAGTESFAGAAQVNQASASAIGPLQPAITAAGPTSVPGELDLTQAEAGPLEDATYLTRGYTPAPVQQPRVGSTPMVAIGAENPAAAAAAAAAATG